MLTFYRLAVHEITDPFVIAILPDHNWRWRLALDAEWTPRLGLPLQKSAQACMIARRRSKLSVRR
jgi:hypothetical protein